MNSMTVSIVKSTFHKYLPGFPVFEAHWTLTLHLPCDGLYDGFEAVVRVMIKTDKETGVDNTVVTTTELT